MDLRLLDDFVAVARSGGFAAAARVRGVDPSSMSRAVAALEEELGLRLFQRTTRRLALTEAGARYLARIEPLLAEVRQAGAEAAAATGVADGVLRLTASVAFGVTRIAPLLAEFRALHPKVRLDCLFTDANLDLVSEQVDLAIRLAPEIDGDFIASRLVSTRYRVVAAPSWLAAASSSLQRPSDLNGVRCLLLALRAFRTRWMFRDRSGAVTEVGIDGDIVMSTPLGLRAAAIAGAGPALLVDWQIARDLADGILVDLFPDHDATATSFDTAAWAIYPSRAYLPAKVRVMLDFLRARLGKSDPG
jgi:DNA-binding transcriptional LysR family regulator